MKIRTMLGLSLVGTALYAHKRHGGEFSVKSFQESLGDLWTAIQNKASDAKDQAGELAGKAEDKVKDVAQKASEVADKVMSSAESSASAPAK